MTKEEKRYVGYLNEVGPNYDSDDWIIGGKDRRNEWFGSYGLAIKKYDPIAFQVGLREFLLEHHH